MPPHRRWALRAILAAGSLGLSSAAAAPPERAQASGPVVDAVAKHLGVYLTTPERREGFERVVAKGDQLEVWFMRPVSDAEAAGCDGLRWLLLGRLASAGGVAPLFDELRMVNEISLIFYDVETQVRPDRQGNYTQSRTPVPHARISMSRARVALLDPKQLDASLKGRNCTRIGQGLVDSYWVRPTR